MRLLIFKKYIIFFILSIIIIISIIGCNFINNRNNKKPGKQDVEKTIDQIKQQERLKEISNIYMKEMLDDFIKDLKNMKFYIQAGVITAVICIVLLALFFLIRFIISRKFSVKKTEMLKKDFQISIFEENYLRKIVTNSDYSQAIIYLHHCSIFYLVLNKISYKKNMTNYDFLKKIEDKNLSNAFKDIYLISEKILFDNYIANEADYKSSKLAFDEYFV